MRRQPTATARPASRAAPRAAPRAASRAAPRVRRRAHRRGMSLVEVMISLAISASLLVAVGTAFVASATAIETNDEFVRASRSARVGMNQVMTEVRRCKSGACDATSLELLTAYDERRVYAYDADARRLTLSFPDQVPAQSYTMARNVTAAEFRTDGDSIAMTVTVQVGRNQITLSSSAVPRSAITFD